ncbi:1-alkyl-2-acetylglycerophosphocholine esterase [Micromonospora noduli]|uniref:alpha/beta hydrolase family protein n=1 Tax=Micromonospora noduli TaxID=709876 RepID=UPI000DC3418D|nr:acetylhydrolase [Micromonospora noduli]RAO13969.1 1-alkyl-2-acetylglycerophosphocholine esterase [Micromonospora noduli]RAO25386.1 1-alkyl-2-acetylglycerophosphocholine esterase [Micromonospora noduli]
MPTVKPVGARGITRRGLVGAALAVGAGVPMGITGRATAATADSGPVRLTLPWPTGPYRVGVVPLHLVDRSRPEPLAGSGRYRELMVSVWYPARNVRRYPRSPWMTAASMRMLLESAGFDPHAALAPLTAGHEGAPVRHPGRRLPVVLYSHGAGSHRSDTTIVVQELASHGYAVVTVDHTYDGFSEFPDGRVTVQEEDFDSTPWTYTRDVRFVLDQISDLAAGGNPDVDHAPLPTGLGAALDLSRIGMFGWSKGGTATALTMGTDRRIRAGLSLDAPMQSQPLPSVDLYRPFMLMTAEYTRAAKPAVAEFFTHLRGWRLNIQAAEAIHSSYGDNQWLVPQLAKLIGMSDEKLVSLVGTLDPARAVRIGQAYPLAFFDLHLRHRGGHLLNGPSRSFPEVRFIP